MNKEFLNLNLKRRLCDGYVWGSIQLRNFNYLIGLAHLEKLDTKKLFGLILIHSFITTSKEELLQ